MATEVINLNKNPLDYPGGLNFEIVVTWNAFQKYLQKIKFVGDVANDFDKTTNTKKVINDYNKNVDINLSNKFTKIITIDNIKAAQAFHYKNDSRVQIDGWVGSETSQLKYPIPSIYYVTAPPKINEAYIDKKGKKVLVEYVESKTLPTYTKALINKYQISISLEII